MILSPLPLSPPLPISSPSLPASPTYPLGYRAAMIWLRAEAPSTSHSPPPHIILSHTRADTPPSGTPPLLPIPLPTSSPPFHLLSTDRRADRPEVTLPPRKRLGIALGPRYEVGESSSAPTARPPGGFRVDYGFVATMDREIRQDLERDSLPLGDRIVAHARTEGIIEALRQGCLEMDWEDTMDGIVTLAYKRLCHYMTEFESQQEPAKGLAQPDAPKEAGSCS
ncbi:hypothetical protein Tco_1489121 [Tanacetum coccineum]